MIAELKNSKNSTMQEDAGDTDSATIPSTIIIKDERISNIGCASATATATATATVAIATATHLQPHHVVLKDESESSCGASESTQTNYKRKLMFALGHDDDGSGGSSGTTGGGGVVGILEKDNMEMADRMQLTCKKPKLCMEKEQMFELFQPWALKTYGDQAKTKTITLRKKARILKALEGKEHSRPDSSKFRFWVKSKAFTTKRPECFENAPDYPASSNIEYPNNIDLYVASTTKDFGQRTYRKVAVVEEFFNIIYNIHVEMGGRSGRHAGQKRTYRIITETFAFLPREAVTRFLSACPECKKNLRPLSPGRSTVDEDIPNESSTDIDILNYSPKTESSMEIPKPPTPIEKTELSIPKESLKPSPIVTLMGTPSEPSDFSYPSMLQKIRINPAFQTYSFNTEPIRSATSVTHASSNIGPQMNVGMLNRESLIRYYDFMRRLYGQSMPITTQPQQNLIKTETNEKPSHSKKTDDQPTTSSATVVMHSESIQEPLHQVCAINLSKNLSSYPMVQQLEEQQHPDVKLEKPKPIPEPKQEPETSPDQLDLRKVKPITSTYLQLTRSMGLSDADALKLDDLKHDPQ